MRSALIYVKPTRIILCEDTDIHGHPRDFDIFREIMDKGYWGACTGEALRVLLHGPDTRGTFEDRWFADEVKPKIRTAIQNIALVDKSWARYLKKPTMITKVKIWWQVRRANRAVTQFKQIG